MAASNDVPVPPRSQPCSGVVVRPALCAGLTFMDVTRGDAMSGADLYRWLRVNIVDPGLGEMPAWIHEAGMGNVALGALGALHPDHEGRVARIASTARVRVAITLAGLVASPPDDRFLAAAIYAGRVLRAPSDRGPAWRAAPRPGDRLSDIVLACFIADILEHREEYDAHLCVCEVCSAVSFSDDPALRTRCERHL